MRSVRDIGPDYAITLRAWRAAWEDKKAAALQLGYSDRFWRKYRRVTACSGLVRGETVATLCRGAGHCLCLPSNRCPVWS